LTINHLPQRELGQSPLEFLQMPLSLCKCGLAAQAAVKAIAQTLAQGGAVAVGLLKPLT
jgi:hypothetical protein